MCLPRATSEFPKASVVERIIELKENVRSIVVGTLIKESIKRIEVQGGISEDAKVVLEDVEGIKAFKTLSDDGDECVMEGEIAF